MIQVISNPSSFNGEEILVRGYLRIRNESRALFLSKSLAEGRLTENSIWVHESEKTVYGGSIGQDKDSALELESYDRKYVLVRGIFDAGDRGHGDAFSGTIHAKEVVNMLETLASKQSRVHGNRQVQE
ncbi:hypothetical protein ACJJI5_14055 [Microbulbifer sp. EKSA008]|uniref:hypothetical protein n=1 Tax=unclassified Microbulbifer TaxID=2619833 RepID=UPI0040398793